MTSKLWLCFAIAVALEALTITGFAGESPESALPNTELQSATDATDDDGATPPQPLPVTPAIQVLAPGFSVVELPVELSNVNNIKYREDGTLVALAYDGTVWLLRDTNGDGLEDEATCFWSNPGALRSPIGMDLTPAGYPHGNGVCVVGKDRCVLIVDTDGDDRADKEIVVATGWKESFHQVDGLGVAFDPRDHGIYFGRGTYNFADPYLRDAEGNPQYNIADESGAVVRVAPDFKSREVVATGIRFPVAIRFNSQGDLFVTDQEGATWVPNGNPFDELLHIQRGRHYGFPARHPTFLPNVIDEPSTFDYGPQHQSVCGFNFNDPVRQGRPVFGPKSWSGDAIVTGYSRGKLYRTQLAKSAAGYIGRTQLLACLNMLTVDACVGPNGELVVACHSGGPDWGSGPTGKGKLFKIRYNDPHTPQPVVAWPAGPHELRIEFDRPLDAQSWRNLLASARLTAGRFVRAGDRFEVLSPGYAAVQAQKAVPATDIAIRSVQMTPDGRTLILGTDRLARDVHYALTLPVDYAQPEAAATEKGSLAQEPAIDLAFDLSGCEAVWTSADGSTTWQGWLPHYDLNVSRQFTRRSAPHDALWAEIEAGGLLTLRGRVNLNDMLQPAVQPGSKLDYEYPPETVTLSFVVKSPATTLRLVVPDDFPQPSQDGSRASLTLASDTNKIIPFELQITCTTGSPELSVDWTTNEDDRPRPVPLWRTRVPWADTDDSQVATAAPAKELDGGSWARGYREFFSDEAACGKCHTVCGRGGRVGPDLSNLLHRDYASVFRDITQPSYAINPDYLSFIVTTVDGRVLTGVVHTTADKVSIGDSQGNIIELNQSQIDDMRPAPVSTMPEEIATRLGADRMRDLMTFLLTPPPQMPRDSGAKQPKPRTLGEIRAALAGAPNPPEAIRPIQIVLVAGAKDHGPGEHDYPAWQRMWTTLLGAADKVEVSTAWEWPSPEQFEHADVLVFYQRGDWNPGRAADIDSYLERGGGLVYIHWAVDGRALGSELAKRIGLAAGPPIAFRHGDLSLAFNKTTNHPIIRNVDNLKLHDESYWKLTGTLPDDRVLATAVEEGRPQPQLWTVEPRNGRIMVSIPGHYSWTFDDPLFRLLLLRGIAWTAHEPVDRFNDLIWPGANLEQ